MINIQTKTIVAAMNEIIDEVSDVAPIVENAIDELEDVIKLDEIEEVRDALSDVIYNLKELHKEIE